MNESPQSKDPIVAFIQRVALGLKMNPSDLLKLTERLDQSQMSSDESRKQRDIFDISRLICLPKVDR